jgi:hypothetical protein
VKFTLPTVLPRAAPVIAACAVLTACTVSNIPDVTASEVVGTWDDPPGTGGSIIFHADGRFNAVAVDVSSLAGGAPQECQSVTGTGRWAFPDSELSSIEVSLVFDNAPCDSTLITTGGSSSSSVELCPGGIGKWAFRCGGFVLTKVS